MKLIMMALKAKITRRKRSIVKASSFSLSLFYARLNSNSKRNVDAAFSSFFFEKAPIFHSEAPKEREERSFGWLNRNSQKKGGGDIFDSRMCPGCQISKQGVLNTFTTSQIGRLKNRNSFKKSSKNVSLY